MAVYTQVRDDEIARFIAEYNVGQVVSFKGIAEGIENTNYMVQTTEASFILTLYEKRVNPDDLPFFLGLMNHLAEKGINCATPVADKEGEILKTLGGRPAALIRFLNGMSLSHPTADNCYELGAALASMHVAASDFNISRANGLALQGWIELYQDCNKDDKTNSSFGEGFFADLDQEMSYLVKNFPSDLPRGVIHADLFPDNVFFLEGKLSGLIDYYFACNDMLAYDVAICINAWCFEEGFDEEFIFDPKKSAELLKGYQSVRSLSFAEIQALPALCRGAAMRFLLTRLYDGQNRTEGALVMTKDPREYISKLKFHQMVENFSSYGI
jgi:homoserine kinase type II